MNLRALLLMLVDDCSCCRDVGRDSKSSSAVAGVLSAVGSKTDTRSFLPDNKKFFYSFLTQFLYVICRPEKEPQRDPHIKFPGSMLYMRYDIYLTHCQDSNSQLVPSLEYCSSIPVCFPEFPYRLPENS